MTNNKYMLDTCAINHIIEDEVKLEFILAVNPKCYITYIQKDELDAMKAKHTDKYSKVFLFLSKIKIKKEPTSVAVLGVWKLGESRLGSGDIYKKVRDYMISKKSNKDHIHDAIIADSAHSYQMSLVTDDGLLIEAASKFDIDVLSLSALITSLTC
jgi:predicted nucleic acid-binding protein